MSLRLHREHGVNPSVEHCCLCGDSIGVVMFGAACKGEAPRKVSMGNVCDKCKGVLDSGGVFVFEAIGPDPDQRTGRMVAITSESASRLFNGHDGHQVIHMEAEAFEKVGFGKACKKNKNGGAV